MYAAIDDPYYYPDTTVLINKLDIKNQRQLDAFELEMSSQRSTVLSGGKSFFTAFQMI
jgi:cell filamentation protein